MIAICSMLVGHDKTVIHEGKRKQMLAFEVGVWVEGTRGLLWGSIFLDPLGGLV